MSDEDEPQGRRLRPRGQDKLTRPAMRDRSHREGSQRGASHSPSQSPGKKRRGRKTETQNMQKWRSDGSLSHHYDTDDSDADEVDGYNDMDLSREMDSNTNSDTTISSRSETPVNVARNTRMGRRRQVATDTETQDPASPSEQSNQTSQPSMLTICTVLVLVVGGVAFFLQQRANAFESNNRANTTKAPVHFESFKVKYDVLRSTYPSQSPRFWKLIGTPVKRVLSELNPSYPAVILLSVPYESSHIGSCLARQLVQETNSVFGLKLDSYIDSRTLDSRSVSKQKLDLDQKLHAVLKSGRGVVVDHIEELPAETALLFHSYCDGDNAPYKEAVIVLVLHMNKNGEGSLSDLVIEKHLSQLWADLGEDEIPALLSRLANNKAILTTEGEEHSAKCGL